MRWTVALAVLALFPGAAVAAGMSAHHSPYAGQQARAIKALSADETADLLAGRGAGFAKAAELNGMPGPAHVLEMAGEIGLDAEQARRIEAVRAGMEADARTLGSRLVALEAELDRGFADGTVTRERLRELLAQVERVRGELRFVHLAAHLETPAILSPEQVRTYNRLRGYRTEDPCAQVPAGHDAAMWRRHNGCTQPSQQ